MKHFLAPAAPDWIMPRRRWSLWAAVLLACVLGLAVRVQPAEAAAVSAAQATAVDPPTPVVTDTVEFWSAGAGLLYWSHNCFGDEFNPFAELKRKPAGGGAERTLESINDGALCVTYLSQLSTGRGLYYYDYSQGRIERMPLAKPYTPQTVKAVDSNQAPASGPLLLAGNYLYWTNGVNQVLRVRADGSDAVQVVANTNSAATDVLVAGNDVYYTDSAGVWLTTVNCATPPCGAQPFAEFGANTLGYSLLYQALGGVRGDYRIYWVEQAGGSAPYEYKIRYRACDQLTACVVAPLPPAGEFYGSTSNWRIGDLLLADGNLYWTERDQGNANNGDVKRRATDATTPGADTLATDQADIDSQVYVVNDRLFFARQGTGIYSLPLNAGAITRDFALVGVEVTQGIQNLANSAPLVADKTTYVRAYARQLGGPSAANVEAWLVGERNGAPLPGSPLRAINGVRALATGGSFDRARLDDGWYFLLPASWTSAGSVTLQGTVDPRQIHSDPNRADNTVSQAVNFGAQPPVCVWTVPVRTHSPLPSTKDPNFWSMVSQFTRRWPVPDTWIFRDTSPVSELQVCWKYGFIPYPCYGPYELSDGWSITNGPPDRDKVIASLWARALLTFNPDACDDRGAPVHFMGMVHPKADNGGASGYASLISKQSWVQLPSQTPNPAPTVWNAIRQGSTMAQELAHNFGRKHVDCGNPDNIDTGYPYPPCQIANAGADSCYGFDIASLQPIRPDQTADFMSYASRSWVSDYTWRSLMGKFLAAAAEFGPANTAPAAEPPASVFVTGLVDTAHGRGEISQLLVLPTGSLPPATRQALQAQAAGQPAADLHTAHQAPGAPAVAYKLRLLDSGGQVLVERSLVLSPLDDHSDESEGALFADLFAPPAGRVAAVQLLAGSVVIDQRTPGANAPTVAIQQPAASAVISDTLTVRWTATDSDAGDTLVFTVQYSHDGGASWHTLALDIPAGDATEHTLALGDLGSLHGSAVNDAVLRVIASDGYNTGLAVSAPFTLRDRAPLPVIVSPAEGQTVAAGKTVILQGSATDAEDGGLSPAALTWQVDGSAAGSGPNSTAAGLAPGSHTAALAATDTTSKTATATASFFVAPLAVADGAAPVLDGVCEDATYAGAGSLPLRPYGPDAQGSVRLLHSGSTLWVCFSGLLRGVPDAVEYVALAADIDNSRSAQVAPGDISFLAAADGDVAVLVGTAPPNWAPGDATGFQAQVSAGPNAWSAELAIDQALLGGWNHLAGFTLGHYLAGPSSDNHAWPYAADRMQPDTWAVTVLGSQPVIASLDPFTATAAGPAFTLLVEGSGFVSGTQVLWDDSALPTTFVDSTHLRAAVAAPRLNTGGILPVTAQAPGGFTSNAVSFLVEEPAPVITSLAPASVLAGSPAQTVTVNGSNFAAGAQVLWNGDPLPTQVLGPTRITVQAPAELLAVGQIVGVAVRNPAPDDRVSTVAPFEVTALNLPLYLPLAIR